MQKDQRTFTTLFCYLLFFPLWGFVLTSWFSLNTGYPTWQITFSVCDVHLTSSVCKGIDLAEYTTLWTVALFHWLFSCFNIHFFPAFYFYLLLFIHFRENKKQILLKKFTQRACCFSHQFLLGMLTRGKMEEQQRFLEKVITSCVLYAFSFLFFTTTSNDSSRLLGLTRMGAELQHKRSNYVSSCNSKSIFQNEKESLKLFTPLFP